MEFVLVECIFGGTNWVSPKTYRHTHLRHQDVQCRNVSIIFSYQYHCFLPTWAVIDVSFIVLSPWSWRWLLKLCTQQLDSWTWLNVIIYTLAPRFVLSFNFLILKSKVFCVLETWSPDSTSILKIIWFTKYTTKNIISSKHH